MIGVELTQDGKLFIDKCIEKGLLLNCTQERVIRIMPPLNVSRKEIMQALGMIDGVLKELS